MIDSASYELTGQIWGVVCRGKKVTDAQAKVLPYLKVMFVIILTPLWIIG